MPLLFGQVGYVGSNPVVQGLDENLAGGAPLAVRHLGGRMDIVMQGQVHDGPRRREETVRQVSQVLVDGSPCGGIGQSDQIRRRLACYLLDFGVLITHRALFCAVAFDDRVLLADRRLVHGHRQFQDEDGTLRAEIDDLLRVGIEGREAAPRQQNHPGTHGHEHGRGYRQFDGDLEIAECLHHVKPYEIDRKKLPRPGRPASDISN